MVLRSGLAALLSYRAIALLRFSMVGRTVITVIAFGLLCHFHACCLGSTCAMVLQFDLEASLNQSNRVAQLYYGWPHRHCFWISYFAISTPAVSAASVPLFFSLALRPYSPIWQSRWCQRLPDQLRGRIVRHFVDNTAALAGSVKGYSRKLDCVRLVEALVVRVSPGVQAVVWLCVL